MTESGVSLPIFIQDILSGWIDVWFNEESGVFGGIDSNNYVTVTPVSRGTLNGWELEIGHASKAGEETGEWITITYYPRKISWKLGNSGLEYLRSAVVEDDVSLLDLLTDSTLKTVDDIAQSDALCWALVHKAVESKEIVFLLNHPHLLPQEVDDALSVLVDFISA